MLTRYEILAELRRVGVREPCLLKAYLRDFENYIGAHYGLKIVKTKKKMEGRDWTRITPDSCRIVAYGHLKWKSASINCSTH